jgi:hypothetical protein
MRRTEEEEETMGEAIKVRLWVEGSAVDLNPFVEQILAGTVVGAVRSLKGTEDMKDLEVVIDKGEVGIRVNAKEVPLTPFPNDIIAHMLTGFVSALKGVSHVETLRIVMESS